MEGVGWMLFRGVPNNQAWVYYYPHARPAPRDGHCEGLGDGHVERRGEVGDKERADGYDEGHEGG